MILHGPVTAQERWQENSGYSPSTLATIIASLVCAAEFALGRNDKLAADFLLDDAAWLSTNLEEWTVTSRGELVKGKPRHYAGTLQTVTLEVKNMTCALCPIIVKKALEKVSGVTNAKVDLEKKTASVTFDPDKVLLHWPKRLRTQAILPLCTTESCISELQEHDSPGARGMPEILAHE